MTYLGHCMTLGEAKCGTSSFHQLLVESGYFSYSPTKELHYFDRACPQAYNFDPLFRPNARDYRIILERGTCAQQDIFYTLDSTPSYFRTLGVSDLVEQYAPNPRKFIVLLRDPVARLYSNYWMLRRRGHYKMLKQKGLFNFDSEQFCSVIGNFISDESSAKQGKLPSFNYAENLLRWKTALGSLENLKVLFFEELFNSPKVIIDEVSDYLGINIELPTVLPKLVPGSDLGAKPKNHYPPIKVEDEKRLQNYFQESNFRLAELLKRDLPWNY